jgi:hypothetical protein
VWLSLSLSPRVTLSLSFSGILFVNNTAPMCAPFLTLKATASLGTWGGLICLPTRSRYYLGQLPHWFTLFS